MMETEPAARRVPHTLEAVRHFNFALSMFNSLHCVMGEQNEMPANIEEDITPGM